MNELNSPTFEEIEHVLGLQERAYETLLWLNNLSLARPHMLNRRVAETLQQTRTCMGWIEQHRGQIPTRLRPLSDDEEAFARLFSSFFQTSFRVELRLDVSSPYYRIVTNKDAADGKSKLKTRIIPRRLARKRREEANRLKIRSLMPLVRDRDQAELVAAAEVSLDDRSLRQDVLMWTYACELVHRAHAESHGPAAHILWKQMEKETRSHLSAYRVWKARERLVHVLNDPTIKREFP